MWTVRSGCLVWLVRSLDEPKTIFYLAVQHMHTSYTLTNQMNDDEGWPGLGKTATMSTHRLAVNDRMRKEWEHNRNEQTREN